MNSTSATLTPDQSATPENGTAVVVPPLATGSAPSFVRDAINKRLAEMRRSLAIKKEGIRHAQDPKSYWGSDSPGSTYWADMKARCAAERPIEYAAALQELADFIAEHRPLMGSDWVPDGHGRQCWAQFQHYRIYYCERPEGHEGNCACSKGAWPQGIRSSQQLHYGPTPQNTMVSEPGQRPAKSSGPAQSTGACPGSL